MSYSAVAIANYFIKRALECNVPMTHMHIQKMVFFAHASYFNTNRKPLFLEPVFAWLHGPVIEPLYHSLKVYEGGCIRSQIQTVIPCTPGTVFPCKAVIPEIQDNDTQTASHLDEMWDMLARMETWRLRRLSHEKGGAWYETVRRYGISIGKEIDPSSDEEVRKILPRNLVILDNVILECGR